MLWAQLARNKACFLFRLKTGKVIFTLFFGFFLFVTYGVALANATSAQADPEKVLSDLANRTRHIKSIKSDFKQTKHISFMNEQVLSTGYFTFEAPDQLLWQYTSPLLSGLSYSNGEARVWSAFECSSPAEATKRVECSRMEENIAKMIAGHILTWVSLDVKKVTGAYNVTIASESPLIISLEPKELTLESPVQKFEVEFVPTGVAVKKILFYEQEGDFTEVEFYNTVQK